MSGTISLNTDLDLARRNGIGTVSIKEVRYAFKKAIICKILDGMTDKGVHYLVTDVVGFKISGRVGRRGERSKYIKEGSPSH